MCIIGRLQHMQPAFLLIPIMNQHTENTIPDQYLEMNRLLWESRVEPHIKSDFYALQAFKEGASSLNEIELPLLGNVSGKQVLHLQCHFGQDTLSLARMGAEVTGIDFSTKAIQIAQSLANEL
jgi:2-polyprenyl-3-methyl-5-hydroxy-6-metoxy-1,4-benzoquinol methylase